MALSGLLEILKSVDYLSRDIRDGLRIGVTGTPSYLIDGKLYVSNIPSNVLSRVMN